MTDAQKQRLELLLNSALKQFQKETGDSVGKFAVRLLEGRTSEQSVNESVNKSDDLDLEDDLSPSDFTAQQLSEARRLFLYEHYSDAEALKKVRERNG